MSISGTSCPLFFSSFHSPSEGFILTLIEKLSGIIIYTWMEKGSVREERLAQEHNIMIAGRTQTLTVCPNVQYTKHYAKVPLTVAVITWFTDVKTWQEQGNFMYMYSIATALKVSNKPCWLQTHHQLLT